MSSCDRPFVTRVFQAGTVPFVVDCPSGSVRDAVETLFVDLVVDGPSGTPTVITLDEDPATGQAIIMVGETGGGAPGSNFTLANLVTAVSRLALDREPERLHLHCASLISNGRGVLISAPSGTGKSTLAIAMIQHGWTYVSDEAVALSPDGLAVSGFAKPLILDGSAVALVPEIEQRYIALTQDDDEWAAPASALGASIATRHEPAAIVLLHRSPNGDTDMPPIAMPLHPADAVVALMGQTMDAERYGPEALNVLAHLAAHSSCVRMNVGPLDAAVSLVSEVVSAVEPPMSVTVFPSQHPSSGGVRIRWSVPTAVRSVMIGDRAIVHDTVAGVIVALDEAGSAVWQALHGEEPEWWQTDAMQHSTTIGFLEQLSAHGLVARNFIEHSGGQ